MAHTCHATACNTRVQPAMWGCHKHWFMVPKALRNMVYLHYRPGQESDWRPSTKYLLAAKAAVVAVAEKEGLTPDTEVYDVFLASHEADA